MKRKPNTAYRDARRRFVREHEEQLAKIKKAQRLEQEDRMVVALARHGITDCGLCRKPFWPWNEIVTVAGIPIHTYCRASWIAGRAEDADPEAAKQRDGAPRSPTGPTTQETTP